MSSNETGGSSSTERPVSFSTSPSFWLATRLPSAVMCALATFVLTFVALQQSDQVSQIRNKEEVYKWLSDVGLENHKEVIFQHGEKHAFFFLRH